MTSTVVGIDVGSYSCYLSVARKGGIETLLNEYSDRCTFSCVAFTDKNRLIGHSAKMQLISHPKNTIDHFVPFLGKKFSDNFVQIELPYLCHKVVEFHDSIAIEVEYCGKTLKLKPEQLMAMLITKLKLMAETELQMVVNQLVINVPASYTVTERRCLAMSLKIAGIECLRIINDLTAVALLYHATRFQSLANSKLVAFVDIGYTYFQASIVRFSKDNFQVILETAEANLGGREFDRIIFDHLTSLFMQKYSIDVRDSSKASIRLMNECEKIKKRLSANSAEFVINIECLMNQIDVSAKIDRTLFENLSSNILSNMKSVLSNFVQQYHQISPYHKEPISCVEVVGGSTRIPCVKSLIAEIFKQETHITLNADEAVSRGCAIQSAMLNSNCVIRRIDYTNYSPYAISLDVYTVSMSEKELMQMETEKREKYRSETIPILHTGQAYPLLGASIELVTDVTIIEIRYSDKDQVPNDNKVIAYLKINPAENSEIDQICRWLLEYEINSSGLFNITGLTLKRNSKSPRPPSKQTPSAMPSYNVKQQSFGRTNKPNNNYDVYGPVDFKIYYMMDTNDKQINEMVNNEKEFVNRDQEEVNRLDTKNQLEESIYKNRELLNDLLTKQQSSKEINSQATIKNIESTMSFLTELENWLFEDGEDVKREKYVEQINKMNKLMQPFSQKNHNKNKNASNTQDELIDLIKAGEEIVNRIEKDTNSTANQSSNSSQNHSNSRNLDVDRLKQFILQSNEILTNFEVYQNNKEEYSQFISDFKKMLEPLNQ